MNKKSIVAQSAGHKILLKKEHAEEFADISVKSVCNALVSIIVANQNRYSVCMWMEYHSGRLQISYSGQ